VPTSLYFVVEDDLYRTECIVVLYEGLLESAVAMHSTLPQAIDCEEKRTGLHLRNIFFGNRDEERRWILPIRRLVLAADIFIIHEIG
jgi:hypothetical protein